VEALIDAGLSLAQASELDSSSSDDVLLHHDFHHGNVLWQAPGDRRRRLERGLLDHGLPPGRHRPLFPDARQRLTNLADRTLRNL
jgi:hypothetical protein